MKTTLCLAFAIGITVSMAAAQAEAPQAPQTVTSPSPDPNIEAEILRARLEAVSEHEQSLRSWAQLYLGWGFIVMLLIAGGTWWQNRNIYERDVARIERDMAERQQRWADKRDEQIDTMASELAKAEMGVQALTGTATAALEKLGELRSAVTLLEAEMRVAEAQLRLAGPLKGVGLGSPIRRRMLTLDASIAGRVGEKWANDPSAEARVLAELKGIRRELAGEDEIPSDWREGLLRSLDRLSEDSSDRIRKEVDSLRGVLAKIGASEPSWLP